MNYISCPLLNIVVSEKSARATYIAFMNELINRIPFVCDRIYSYMDQVFLPQVTGKVEKRHILAMDRKTLNPLETHGNNSTVELVNGWFLYCHSNPWGYARTFVGRIEEAIQLPIIVIFERDGGQNVYDDTHGAHRNINKTEHDLLVLTTPTK